MATRLTALSIVTVLCAGCMPSQFPEPRLRDAEDTPHDVDAGDAAAPPDAGPPPDVGPTPTSDAATPRDAEPETDAGPRPEPPGEGCANDGTQRAFAPAAAAVQELVRLRDPSGVRLRVPGPSAELGGAVLWTFQTTVLDAPNGDATLPSNIPTCATQSFDSWFTDTDFALDEQRDGRLIPALLRTPEEVSSGGAITLSPLAIVARDPEDLTTSWAFVLEHNLQAAPNTRFATWVGSARADEPPIVRDSAPIFGSAFGDYYQPMAALYDPSPEAAATPITVYACELDAQNPFSPPCIVARAPANRANDRGAYRAFVRDQSGNESWDADLTKATPVFQGATSSLSVSYNPHLGKFLAVNPVFGANTLHVQSAPSASGPWTDEPPITLPAPALAGAHAAFGREHIALSPDCGKTLVFSYVEPTAMSEFYPTAGQSVYVALPLE